MFTGLVQQVGALVAKRPGSEQQTLVVAARLPAGDREPGASVAVSGVCLTVTTATETELSFDAAFETLRRTTLGSLPIGAPVNLEPSLHAGDPLGGHLVSGHVDGVGTVRSAVARGEAREVWVDVPVELMGYCAPKGSIAIDGTSLTINAIDAKGLCVGLVPHTLRATTLHALAAGQAVNLEVDLVARYVARLLEHRGVLSPQPEPAPSPGLSVDALVEAGYLDPGDGRR